MTDDGRDRQSASEDVDRPLQVVCLDDDEDLLADIAACIDSVDDVTVWTTTDPEEVYAYVRRDQPDCIVTESSLENVEWGWLGTTADVPVVLYTRGDPAAIDDETLAAADTLVHKREGTPGHRFLVEKIRGTVDSSDTDTERALSDAASALAEDVDTETALFLVDGEDVIRWSNRSFEDVFPADAVGGSVPETDNLRRRLAALLDNEPELTRDVLAKPGESVFGLPIDDPDAFYRSDRVPAGDAVQGDRLYVFQPVTDAVQRYDESDQFERLVETLRDGLYILDAEARLRYCNEAYAEMFGYDREEMLGQHTSAWMAPGELQKGQQAVEKMLNSETDSHVVDLDFRTKDGRQITRSVHFTLRKRHGGYAGLLGLVHRPSEIGDTAARYERYRPLVDGLSVPALVVDTECCVELCNESAEALLGSAVGSLREGRLRHALAGIPGGDELAVRVREALGEAAEETTSWMVELGTTGDCYTVTVDTLTEAGDCVGSLVCLRDEALPTD